MKLHVTFETGHPSRLDGLDGIVAVVHQDERPLRGVATHADWRLNGFLSRLVMDGRFAGEAGEWLLVHTQGRMPYTHLFLVGMGRKGERTTIAARQALKGIAGKVALAGVHAFAIDLSELIPAELTPEEAMVTFLEALSQSYPEDDLSDPPYRPALAVRARNDERLAAARARRGELLEARRRWESERAAEAAAAAAQAAAGQAVDPDGDEGDRVLDSMDRPVAGAVPDSGQDDFGRDGRVQAVDGHHHEGDGDVGDSNFWAEESFEDVESGDLRTDEGSSSSVSLSGSTAFDAPDPGALPERPAEPGWGPEPDAPPVTRSFAARAPAHSSEPPPPDPSTVADPELEPQPERTVRVVLLGDAGTVGAMRQRLKDLTRADGAPIDIEWSR